MKKILVGIVSLMFLFVLTGCGGVDSVILSTNTCEIVARESYTLSYKVIPEDADTSGLKWESANEEIAVVDSNGVINAQVVGQTSVYLTDGEKIYATCSVNVLPIPAYSLLSEEAQKFVDCVLRHIDDFKNPDSVKIEGVQYIPGDEDTEEFWTVKVSAENSFGATSTETYWLNNTMGFHGEGYAFFYMHDSEYRLDLINKAIADKR